MARVARSRWRNAAIASLSGSMLVAFASGCVTVAEFRKLEARVVDLQRAESTDASRRELADSGADIDSLRGQVQQLSGRFEVSEKKANDALSEVRRLREELAAINTRALAAVSEGEAGSADDGGAEGEPEADEGPPSAEVLAYRQAYAFWRGDDHGTCIDEFRSFLQTYPASPYADDAAFWMADCHYKQGDYKNAVLRFDDVVRNYPTGNRAPDALYRQGESLLKLGPSYHEAAKRAFQRVLKEYPDSARAAQASDQLKLIEAG